VNVEKAKKNILKLKNVKCDKEAIEQVCYSTRKSYKHGDSSYYLCIEHYNEYKKEEEAKDKAEKIKYDAQKQIFEESIGNNYEKYYNDLYNNCDPCGKKIKQKHLVIPQHIREYKDPQNYGFRYKYINKLGNCNHCPGHVLIKKEDIRTPKVRNKKLDTVGFQ